MTGGYAMNGENRNTDKTEMMMISENKWKLLASANLPVPIFLSAALTINNQVYLFGNLSKL